MTSPRILCATLFAALILSGCQHSRSFLQMDSNSRVPFLGLQLSVDARPPGGAKNADALPVVSHQDASQETIVDLKNDSEVFDQNYVNTSTRTSQTGSVKYSLPRVDLKADTQMESHVNDIISRW